MKSDKKENVKGQEVVDVQGGVEQAATQCKVSDKIIHASQECYKKRPPCLFELSLFFSTRIKTI